MKQHDALIALALSLLLSVTAAGEAPPTLEKLLHQNSYSIGHNGELGGPGLDFLLREARQAQFVVLGEPHNVKQVPELTTALFEALHARAGFNYLALEQGPFIMEEMSRAGRSAGRRGVAEVARRYPSSLHFYTDQELHMIADVAAIPGQVRARVWGVDRSRSSVLALEQLAAGVSDSEVAGELRRLAGEARAFCQAHLREQKCLMGTRFERFESLPRQAKGQDEDIRWGLEWLARSSRNVRLYLEAGRESPAGYLHNLEREEMMKDAFLRLYRRAVAAGDTLPRVLFKSGHWHSRRGLGWGSVYTLGNLVGELARSNGLRSLHIDITVLNRPGQHWSISDSEEFAPLTAVSALDRWTLIDLRPLRPYLHSGLFKVDPKLEDRIFAFDFALVLGNTEEGSLNLAMEILATAQE